MKNDIDSLEDYSFSSVLWLALKRHKKGILLVIFLALLSSTFAWIYANTVAQVKINVGVESWNVSIGNSPEYEFTFDRVSPGVTYDADDEKYIVVTNNGDKTALLTLEIKEIFLFGELLTPDVDYRIETLTEEVDDVEQTYYTIKGFPFNIDVHFPKTVLEHGQTTTIDFTFDWPYRGDPDTCLSRIMKPSILDYVAEQKTDYMSLGSGVFSDTEPDTIGNTYISTCDIIDTYYGERQYEFQQLLQELIDEGTITSTSRYYDLGDGINRPTKSLSIVLSLKAVQQNNIEEPPTS